MGASWGHCRAVNGRGQMADTEEGWWARSHAAPSADDCDSAPGCGGGGGVWGLATDCWDAGRVAGGVRTGKFLA